jgi:hypothetical protein
VQDGDPFFKGIDMLHDRAIVGQNYLARCENKRLRDGPASTRGGTSEPPELNPVFTNRIIGSYIYSNINGDEVMLVAEANQTFVWQLQYNTAPVKINLNAGEGDTGAGGVEFCQAFDKVLLLRRPNATGIMLMWDGFPAGPGPPVHTGTFDRVQSFFDPTSGLNGVVTTWFAEPFENRVLYYFVNGTLNWRTQFNASDILDPSSYDDIYGAFRVSAAQSDQLTRLIGWQKGTLLAFMQHSIYVVENFTVDPTQTTQRVLSTKVGNVGNKVPVLVGSEVFFLSDPGGFYKVSQVIQDQIGYEPVPISRSIQPIIDRIDFGRPDFFGTDFAGCSEALGDYCFFAVPLLDLPGIPNSGANNAVLVYNTVTSEWESAPDWWDDANFRIDRLHVTRYAGARRLFGLDYTAKKIYLMYEGQLDYINGNSLTVKDVIETRGYVAGDPSAFKRFERLILGIRTLQPDITVTAVSDGVDEELELATITKNGEESYVHGRGPTYFPKLEDYTIGAVNFVAQDFESLPVGDISVLPPVNTAAVSLLKQQSLERFPIGQVGRWCSIRVENASGEADVLGIAIEGIPIQEGVKVIA